MVRTKLSVNLNKVALIRNSRSGNCPDPVHYGRIALEAGAAGLTVHPRPDERHIRRSDLKPLADLVAQFPGAEFNIEGNPFENLMPIIREIRPHQVTFVPDSVEQKTSDHGFGFVDPAVRAKLVPVVAEAKALGCRVSLFTDPDPEYARWAKEVGADRIELYTEAYAAAWNTPIADAITLSYEDTAKIAETLSLGVNAGHDLSLENVRPLLKACRNVLEVSIGHAFTAEALELGFAETVRRYNAIFDELAAEPDGDSAKQSGEEA